MLKKILFSFFLFSLLTISVVLAAENLSVDSASDVLGISEAEIPQKAEVASESTVTSNEETQEEDLGFLSYQEPTTSPNVDIKSVSMRAGGSLFIVVIILVITVLILKFILAKKDKPFFKERMISILERNYIEPKKAIILVRTLDRLLVVSVAGDNINVLSEIKEPDVVNKAITGDFHGYMQKYTTTEGKKD